jgi:lysophospholipase L1-like esterase
MHEPLAIAALGDSITAGSPYWDPDPAVRETIGSALDERHCWPYWAERANPGTRIENHGVYGERTDEIAARLDGAIAGADVLVVQGGINDVVQGRATGSIVPNLQAMLQRGRAAGLRVAIANVLPWNNGFPGKDEPIRALNAAIARLAAAEDVPLLDFFGTLDDPGRPGTMRDDWQSDGDHPSLAGYRRLGELAFTVSVPSRPSTAD